MKETIEERLDKQQKKLNAIANFSLGFGIGAFSYAILLFIISITFPTI